MEHGGATEPFGAFCANVDAQRSSVDASVLQRDRVKSRTQPIDRTGLLENRLAAPLAHSPGHQA